MAIEIIGSSGNIADVDSSGNLKVNIEMSESVSVSNFPATQPVSAVSLPLPAGATQDGTDNSGVSQPSGGTGIRGWLSAIYKALTGTITAAISGTVAVTGTFWQATQPVSGTVELVAGSAAIGSVSVSNFPATQAVSAASLPLPAGASTDASLTNGNQKTQVTSLPSIPAGVAAIGSVSVSNFPATQPVSGTVALGAGSAAIGSVSVSNFPDTQPVSAASLPLPANAAQETGGNLAALVTNTSTIATNTANETSGAQKTQVSDPTTFTGANVSAKGTQGANALAVQDLKDAGRSKVILSSTRVISITTEALLSLTQKKGDGTTTTGTSYTVTAGKTLRIQSLKIYAQLNTAVTAAWVSCRLREGAASGGAVSATSDIIAIGESNTVAVTDIIGIGVPPSIINFPDGLEIAGGQQIGVSELALNVDLTVTVVLIGYEY